VNNREDSKYDRKQIRKIKEGALDFLATLFFTIRKDILPC
jgi:hypothetical protein